MKLDELREDLHPRRENVPRRQSANHRQCQTLTNDMRESYEGTTVVFAAMVALTALSLSAETLCQTCSKSFINGELVTAMCAQAAHMQEGNIDCVVPHDLPPDCSFSGSACSTYAPLCFDENRNGVCDRNEPVGTCGPDYPPDQCASPLVIADEKYRFSDASDPVMFDINADGFRDRITWTARGGGVKFLWLDLNRNGQVDNGRELFGNHTSKAASNGFLALAQWDNPPYNGQIDEFDQVWPHLRLWDDVNHDGVSQPEEITWLDDSAISALGLEYDVKKKDDKVGNQLRFRADLWRGEKKEKYYDVYFMFVP